MVTNIEENFGSPDSYKLEPALKVIHILNNENPSKEAIIMIKKEKD